MIATLSCTFSTKEEEEKNSYFTSATTIIKFSPLVCSLWGLRGRETWSFLILVFLEYKKLLDRPMNVNNFAEPCKSLALLILWFYFVFIFYFFFLAHPNCLCGYNSQQLLSKSRLKGVFAQGQCRFLCCWIKFYRIRSAKVQ